MERADVIESGRRIDKKHRDKSGEMLWIFFARDERGGLIAALGCEAPP
jgi:hypothetical protein